jgi:hypothetical protein
MREGVRAPRTVFLPEIRQALVGGAELVGSDGKGAGGLLGFCEPILAGASTPSSSGAGASSLRLPIGQSAIHRDTAAVPIGSARGLGLEDTAARFFFSSRFSQLSIRFLASAMASFRAPLKIYHAGVPPNVVRKRDQQNPFIPA